MDKISDEHRSDLSLVSLFPPGLALLHQHIYTAMYHCYVKLNKITSVTSRIYKKENHKNVGLFEEGWFYFYINKCSLCWRFDASHSYNDPDDKKKRNSKENSLGLEV